MVGGEDWNGVSSCVTSIIVVNLLEEDKGYIPELYNV